MAHQNLRRRGNCSPPFARKNSRSSSWSCDEKTSLLSSSYDSTSRNQRKKVQDRVRSYDSSRTTRSTAPRNPPSAAHDTEIIYKLFGILSDCVSKLAVEFRQKLSHWLRSRRWPAPASASNASVEPTPATCAALRMLRLERETAFDAGNQTHEDMLAEIWGLLQPEVPFERVGKQWSCVGFQGKDPATDFRGQGLLGLRSLLALCRSHTAAARRMLSREGFPLAIAAINISSFLTTLVGKHAGVVGNALFDGSDCASESEVVGAFNELFCLAFLHFEQVHSAAIEQYLASGGIHELTVMQFNVIRAKFMADLEEDVGRGTFDDVFVGQARDQAREHRSQHQAQRHT